MTWLLLAQTVSRPSSTWPLWGIILIFLVSAVVFVYVVHITLNDDTEAQHPPEPPTPDMDPHDRRLNLPKR